MLPGGYTERTSRQMGLLPSSEGREAKLSHPLPSPLLHAFLSRETRVVYRNSTMIRSVPASWLARRKLSSRLMERAIADGHCLIFTPEIISPEVDPSIRVPRSTKLRSTAIN